MRSVKKRILWTLLFLSVALVFWPGVTAAQQLTMYELTEQVKLDTSGFPVLSLLRTAALQGTSPAGTPVCPSALGMSVCTLTATATASGDPRTGSLSVTGNYAVVVQEPGSVDSPEVVVQEGTFDGTVDLTPVLVNGLPFLGISGTFTPNGGATSNFTGKFRIPFSLGAGGARVGPKPGQSAFYLKDSGQLQSLKIDELSLGYATVRLEVTFQ